MDTKTLARSLTVMLAFIMQHEFCDSFSCPVPKAKECDVYLLEYYDLVHIYSPKYKVNFMCDTKTDGGGWTIIQRRVNKDTSFFRDWKTYKNGFGSKCNDYWIGNKYLRRITSKGRWDLRIDMKYKYLSYYAVYSGFYIDSEKKNYTLHFKKFVDGNVKDMLKYHNDLPFTTPDMDYSPDGHDCGKRHNSGWWHTENHYANLNGVFADRRYGHGVNWRFLTTDYDSVDSVEMKIREVF